MINNQDRQQNPSFDRWLNSLSNAVGDIASLEVNTAIVEEIIEEIFIPWETYQEIYAISSSTLALLPIESALKNRYLQLRRQLELEYNLLLIDPKSSFYDRRQQKQIKRNLPLLASNNPDWESLPSRLPAPIAHNRRHSATIKRLLQDRYFLGILRKLGSVKTTLDRYNPTLDIYQTNNIDVQTTIHLDGKITNRYTSQILNHPDRQRILELHSTTVASGEKQWRGLINFVLGIVR